ncbi:DUF305 domain-containing protein [Flavisolibacter sp. BT320]|nr:DUF305 domain-containing protein [Flavisolibacter longurius]
MKNTFFFLSAFLAIFLIACDKDNDGMQLQSHDDNRMMDSMHAVMARMEAEPETNDPEIDFPRMMIHHHQGAINMGNVQLQAGSNDSLKRFSHKMILAQQMEIQELSAILAAQTVNNSVPAFTMEQMDHMMKMDQMADVQLITGDIDNDFATLMIVHHNSAIENSEAYLMYGNNTQLKAIAQKMIDDQKKEIKELSDWLKANKR